MCSPECVLLQGSWDKVLLSIASAREVMTVKTLSPNEHYPHCLKKSVKAAPLGVIFKPLEPFTSKISS